MSERTATPAPGRTAGRAAHIRLPFAALIAPLLTLFCVLPLATAGGWWAAAFALPALVLMLVLAGGTTATSQFLSARWWRGRRRLAWDQLDRIEFPGSRWAVAVSHSGDRMVLPGVRPRDLPGIVSAAGGRLFLQRPIRAGETGEAAGETGETGEATGKATANAADDASGGGDAAAGGGDVVADGAVGGAEDYVTGGKGSTADPA